MTRATIPQDLTRIPAGLSHGDSSPFAALLNGLADRLERARRPDGGTADLPASVAAELGDAEPVETIQVPVIHADWTQLRGLPGERG
jgi:hypothetical protein